MRGKITQQIKDEALELLDDSEFSTTELRLLPYIQYVMVNNQRIDPNRINPSERAVLSRWRAAGFMEGGENGLAITEDFWKAINRIVWLAYVAYEKSL